jgi:hypothetical protein
MLDGMAPQAKSQKKGAADVTDPSEPRAVAEALLNAGVDMEWAVKQLKKFAEDGTTPAQLTCLKMAVQLLLTGGLYDAMQMGSGTRRPKIPKEKMPETVDGQKPNVDAVVDEYLAQEKVKRGDREEKENERQGADEAGDPADGDEGGRDLPVLSAGPADGLGDQ